MLLINLTEAFGTSAKHKDRHKVMLMKHDNMMKGKFHWQFHWHLNFYQIFRLYFPIKCVFITWIFIFKSNQEKKMRNCNLEKM